MGPSLDHEGQHRNKTSNKIQETFGGRRYTTDCANVGLKSSTNQEGTSLKNITCTRYEAETSYIALP